VATNRDMDLQVRKWKCAGGHACSREDCWYFKDSGERNTSVFLKPSNGEFYCNLCKRIAESTGECPALRFTVKGKNEVAHVHCGKHNHGIDVAVDQETRERFAIHAMKLAANAPHLTPSWYTQCNVRELLSEKMGDNASLDNVNLEE
jgi:hypothetical protein